MANSLEGDRVASFLPHIIGPISRIVDDDTLKGAKLGEWTGIDVSLEQPSDVVFTPLEELKALAVEVSELIQKRVGTTRWASAYSIVQRRTIEKRRERKTARLMQVSAASWLEALLRLLTLASFCTQGITNPEAAMKRKASHNAKAHQSRKRKAAAYA